MLRHLVLACSLLAGATLFPTDVLATTAATSAPLPVGCSTTGAIALDGSEIYWATETHVTFGSGDPNTVYAAPLSGGPARTLMTLRGAASLAVDASDVFVAQQYDMAPANGRRSASWIAKVPKAGGAAVMLVRDRTNVRDLHVDTSHLFWSEASGVFVSNKDGSGVTSMHGRGGRLAADDAWLYVSDWTGTPVCGECKTGVTERGGRILAIAKSGKTTRVVAEGLLEIQAIASDDANLYAATWSSYAKASGEIVRIDKKTGKKEVLAGGQELPVEIEAMDRRVAYTSPQGILVVEKTKPAAPVRLSPASHVRRLRAPTSGSLLYWTGAVESAAFAAQSCSAMSRRSVQTGVLVTDTGTIWSAAPPSP